MKAPYINNIRCFHFISSSFSLKHMTQFTEYSLFSCECRLYIGCSFQILEMLLFASIEVFWNVNRYIYNQVTYSITIDRRQSFSPKPEYFSGLSTGIHFYTSLNHPIRQSANRAANYISNRSRRAVNRDAVPLRLKSTNHHSHRHDEQHSLCPP